MTSPASPVPPSGPPAGDGARAVVGAIERLMAARLGRAFVPLGILVVLGVAGLAMGAPWGGAVALGAVMSAGAILGYGVRVVQRALGRPGRPWMLLAGIGTIVPPLYGMYVSGWQGLRALALASTLPEGLLAVTQLVLGVWLLRTWIRVMEIERLAKVMMVNIPSSPSSDGASE